MTIGQQIGSYEITALLGKGGMGEVYRARDTRLKRDVAIKILPGEFSRDADRVSRFQREAEVLASLNHPNIAGIYDLAEANASRYLVLELVEGETLVDRIARWPIPLEEVLGIAKQICEAMEAAHEKGIIHRDLKPANVKLTADGKVKVLDFGLAKALGGAVANVTLSNSPTLTMAGTNAGVIIGTAAYMSPEQAKGFSADPRSDIFSFGCVLYEMLTGRQAFQGDTVSELLASILKVDPDLTLLPPDLNPAVGKLLCRCFEKNPRRRWYAAGDLRIELEAVSAQPYAKQETTPAPVSAAKREKLAWALLVVSIIAAAAIGAALYIRNVRPGDSPVMRFEVELPPGVVIPFISPDGKRIAMRDAGAVNVLGRIAGPAGSAIVVRSLENVSPQVLPGTQGAGQSLFWSPDGHFIGFFADGKLKKVDVFGLPPQTLCDAPNTSGAWNREGVILFGSNDGPIHRVSALGGPVDNVTELDKSRGETSHTRPYFLPDGRHFLFTARNAKGDNNAIFIGSLGSKEKKLLTTQNAVFSYSPEGYLLFVLQTTLMAQRFDLSRLELQGEPFPIAEQLAQTNAFSVSGNGILVYRTGNSGNPGDVLMMTDRAGQQSGVIAAPATYGDAVLSPDQHFLALDRGGQNLDIWIADLTRGTQSRFTFDPGDDAYSVWSPDGTRIVFSSNRNGGVANLYEKPSGGAGQEQLLLKTDRPKTPVDWSRDGRYLIYEELDAKNGADLWLLPMFGDKKPMPYLKTAFNERQAHFSPDGRWIAYASDESGQNQVYVQAFPLNGSKWQVSTDAGIQPQWRADGKELFYVLPNGTRDQMMAVEVSTKPGDSIFKAGAPKKLFTLDLRLGEVTGPAGAQARRNSYDVTKDGQHFIVDHVGRDVPDVRTTMTVVVNWPATFNKK